MAVGAITPLSGRNSLIYVSGAELPGANAWSLDIGHDNIEYNVFNDLWKNNFAGLIGWTGSLTTILDSTAKQLIDAAVAEGTVAILIYPALVTTSYWSGNAVFSYGSSAEMSSAIGETASLVGDGALTPVGFA